MVAAENLGINPAGPCVGKAQVRVNNWDQSSGRRGGGWNEEGKELGGEKLTRRMMSWNVCGWGKRRMKKTDRLQDIRVKVLKHYKQVLMAVTET